LSVGLEVAVKFILKDKVPIHSWTKDSALGIVPIEVYVIKNVHHKNIIDFLDFFEVCWTLGFAAFSSATTLPVKI
jgi:hypothetical protein